MKICILRILIFVSLFSCGDANISTGDKVYVTKEKRLIKGSLKIEDSNYLDNIQLNIINPDGSKVKEDSFFIS